MGIKQLYKDNLRKLPTEYGDVSVMNLNRTCGLESSNQSRLMRDRVCYNCGKKDHFIRDCPFKTNRKPGTTVKAAAAEITDNINTLSEKKAENVTVKHTEHQDNETKSVATCIALFTDFNSDLATQTTTEGITDV